MIEISFFSWDKMNNQGLCDLKEIQTTKMKKFKLSSTGVIFRNISNYQLMFIPIKNVPKQGIIQDYQAIIFITQINEQYKLTNLKDPLKCQQWLSYLSPTKKQKDQLHIGSLKLFEGSLIKLGKTIIQILKIQSNQLAKSQNLYKKPTSQLMQSIKKISKQDYKYQQQPNNNNPSSQVIIKSNISQADPQKNKQLFYSLQPLNPICKICYSRTIDDDNELISLCKCNGSTKFIHEVCLKKWVQHKSQLISIQKKNEKSMFVASMKGFQCQICKQYYPIDKVFELLFPNHEESMKQYIILSVFTNEQKYIHIINLFQRKKIKIGRDLQNDVIVNDLTVSRKHCQIQFNQLSKSLELTDLDSKFGSSVKKSSITINQKNKDKVLPMKLQRGRTFIQVNRIKNKQKKKFLQKLLMCYEAIQ